MQNTVDSTSLPKTKALSVYETQTSKITGDDAEGLELVETTIEGVNPIYIPAATRGTVTTSLNFQGLNKPFSIFACKNGGPVANYLYILLSAKHSVLHPNSLPHCSLDDFMLVTSPLFVFCYPWR